MQTLLAQPDTLAEDHAALAAATGAGVGLCTIVGIEGGFSRRLGAQLAILPDSSTIGSLADGCLEAQLAADLRDTLLLHVLSAAVVAATAADGTAAARGKTLFTDNCAVCHGDFGEGVGRWPVLAGGQDTLTEERPEKTIGSYWPYLSTVYDYVRRAMPYGNARSLSDDDVYALTAYLLYLNDIVEDEDFELSKDNFLEIRLPNEENFIADDRAEEPHYAAKAEPCMSDCKDSAVEITMRARILDVTPGSVDDDEASGMGGVD